VVHVTTPGERAIYEVGPDEAGERLDRYLAKRHESESRSRLKALILEGAVMSGDVALTDPAYKVRVGEEIALISPEPDDPVPQPEKIALNIVFEDRHLIVIDKPVGLVVHPAPGNWTGTLVNALLGHCGAELSGIGGVKRPGIVHRLDKDTSGLMVVAKSDRAHRGLAAAFAEHGRDGSGLERAYRAFALGVPEPRTRRIDMPLGRDPGSRVRMAVVRGASGKEAITHVNVEAVFAAARVSEVVCRLETGRTHQIRVHMTAIGHPLLGDPVYGAGFRTRLSASPESVQTAVAALGRQALHAETLGFPHPVTREDMLFHSDLPADMQALRAVLASP
jgi:23S rRNA pseudouridine1911/1915/1917 synthase